MIIRIVKKNLKIFALFKFFLHIFAKRLKHFFTLN